MIIILLLIVLATFLHVRNVETYEDPITMKIHKDLIKLHPEAQRISIQGSDQSFTEDKTRMYLCLYDENGNYYDYNMLMYVAIHELAHVISKSVDPEHKTDEFKNNFKFLLKRAANQGLYDESKPINYSYCPKNNKKIKEQNQQHKPTTGSIIEPKPKHS